MTPVAFRVLRNDPETHDTFTLCMAPVTEGRSFAFYPGQFNMLYAFGVGESAISISGHPERSDTLIHTVRRVGAVTQALAALQPGDSVGVRGPFGSAWPMPQLAGRDLMFVAGGIGLAPLRPAIYQALSHRQHYKNIIVLAGNRAPRDVLYGDEISQWKQIEGVRARVTVDHVDSDWASNVGVVTRLIGSSIVSPANTVALICGPEIMMRYAVLELRALGVADDRILLTLERNMKCAVGFCGHCQFGPEFICRDGPVFPYDRIRYWFSQREL